jgi:hypothetical protein
VEASANSLTNKNKMEFRSKMDPFLQDNKAVSSKYC